jgi:hypothetical protein
MVVQNHAVSFAPKSAEQSRSPPTGDTQSALDRQ